MAGTIETAPQPEQLLTDPEQQPNKAVSIDTARGTPSRMVIAPIGDFAANGATGDIISALVFDGNRRVSSAIKVMRRDVSRQNSQFNEQYNNTLDKLRSGGEADPKVAELARRKMLSRVNHLLGPNGNPEVINDHLYSDIVAGLHPESSPGHELADLLLNEAEQISTASDQLTIRLRQESAPAILDLAYKGDYEELRKQIATQLIDQMLITIDEVQEITNGRVVMGHILHDASFTNLCAQFGGSMIGAMERSTPIRVRQLIREATEDLIMMRSTNAELAQESFDLMEDSIQMCKPDHALGRDAFCTPAEYMTEQFLQHAKSGHEATRRNLTYEYILERTGTYNLWQEVLDEACEQEAFFRTIPQQIVDEMRLNHYAHMAMSICGNNVPDVGREPVRVRINNEVYPGIIFSRIESDNDMGQSLIDAPPTDIPTVVRYTRAVGKTFGTLNKSGMYHLDAGPANWVRQDGELDEEIGTEQLPLALVDFAFALVMEETSIEMNGSGPEPQTYFYVPDSIGGGVINIASSDHVFNPLFAQGELQFVKTGMRPKTDQRKETLQLNVREMQRTLKQPTEFPYIDVLQADDKINFPFVEFLQQPPFNIESIAKVLDHSSVFASAGLFLFMLGAPGPYSKNYFRSNLTDEERYQQRRVDRIDTALSVASGDEPTGFEKWEEYLMHVPDSTPLKQLPLDTLQTLHRFMTEFYGWYDAHYFKPAYHALPDTIQRYFYKDERFETPEAFTQELIHIITTGEMSRPFPDLADMGPIPEDAVLKYKNPLDEPLSSENVIFENGIKLPEA